jgi:hypothetical protein
MICGNAQNRKSRGRGLYRELQMLEENFTAIYSNFPMSYNFEDLLRFSGRKNGYPAAT